MMTINQLFYFTVNKLNYNESCSESTPCNDIVGLDCMNGICGCTGNQYFNGKVCSNFKNK